VRRTGRGRRTESVAGHSPDPEESGELGLGVGAEIVQHCGPAPSWTMHRPSLLRQTCDTARCDRSANSPSSRRTVGRGDLSRPPHSFRREMAVSARQPKGSASLPGEIGGIKIVLDSPRTDEPPSWSGTGRSYRRRSSARAPQRTTTPQLRFRRFSEALRSDWPREDLFAPRFKARAMDLYRFSEGRPLAVAELAIGTETFRK
jgi:hypothetical protein